MKIVSATGRRKNAVAQVRLALGTGKITVNKREFEDYFPVEVKRMEATSPFRFLDVEGKYDVFATVRGGGITGQAGAIKLAISRALAQIDEDYRKALRKAGYLTRDPRMVERKKYGQKKARKRFQFSKR